MNHEGKAKGGAARMASMTPEQRKENAKMAAEAKKFRQSLPKATHQGEISIGEAKIPCFVLSDGRRVISGRALTTAIGMKGRGQGVARISAHKLINHRKNNNLILAIENPIKFMGNNPKGLSVPSDGYEATILQELCEALLDARDSNLCQTEQDLRYVKQADILTRGFARVGIVALVDEATGYQDEREKNALAKILEKFVAKELQPWMKTFPKDYYEQLFRLYGIPYPPQGNPSWKPQFFGHVTNNVVYERLAPEILPELKSLASKAEKKAKLHQWLSSDIGHPKLREHLASIVTLLKISTSKDQFHQLVDQIHPKLGQNKSLDI